MNVSAVLSRSLFAVLVLAAAFVPASLRAQSDGGASAAPTGWGAAWVGPANERQHRQQDFLKRCKTLYDARDFRGEITLCDHAILKEAGNPFFYVVRAHACFKLKQYDRALQDEDSAVALARRRKLPKIIAAYLYERSLFHSHRRFYPAALADLQEAVKLQPDYLGIRNSLAWLRATAPDASVRSGRDAVAQARAAVALSSAGHTCGTLDTLAAAYAEAGDFAQAVESEQRALAVAPREIKDGARAGKFQKEAADRLILYGQHQSYHAEIFPD